MADGFGMRSRPLRVMTGLAAMALLVTACSSGATSAPSGAGSTTLGSNESDAVPKAAVAAMTDYCSTKTGVSVKINTTDHNTFQNQISSYLQGTPDDVVKWFAGERLRFFAKQNLLTPIDDVWAKIEANMTPVMKANSTGADGKLYFVPVYNYPWVVLYRKSLFTDKGYTVPKTIDEFVTLAKKMQTDGIVPLAFGDKDGWPAMGTFDILNMRLNGYDFHEALMAGTQKWTDPKVKAVFQKWAELLPYFQQGAPGRTWQDAAKAALVDKKAGMYFLGTFAVEQAGKDSSDVGFFQFPTFGTSFDAENAIDAPVDGFMLSKAPKNLDAAKAFLECVGSPEAEVAYVTTTGIGSVAVSPKADTSKYTSVQSMSADVLKNAAKQAQFMDRDTRSDFAGPSGMQGFLLNFLNNPTQDLDKFLSGIQTYYDSLPAQ
jgi:multiple sugar transport system substrate-binding protein